ncbi:hypothetical protein Sjap_009498 [Stephania japonica]|uniref:Uncharacterized protein n=1 Tax=Stephania japonica TaxID=461633 RepID=A0AAP0JS95_9MAGN
MVFHLSYDYMLEHGLVCDDDRVDRSRMYLQLSRGIKGTLRTKKLGKEHDFIVIERVMTSVGNLLTGLVAVCVGQLSADPGMSKSKGKEGKDVGDAAVNGVANASQSFIAYANHSIKTFVRRDAKEELGNIPGAEHLMHCLEVHYALLGVEVGSKDAFIPSHTCSRTCKHRMDCHCYYHHC